VGVDVGVGVPVGYLLAQCRPRLTTVLVPLALGALTNCVRVPVTALAATMSEGPVPITNADGVVVGMY